MKKRYIFDVLLLIIFLLYIVFYKTILITKLLKYELLITSLFLIVFSFISYLLLGYKYNKENIKKKNVFDLLIYEILMYFVIFYGSGLLFGFNKNIYSLEISRLVDNIIFPFLIVVSLEIIRNIVIQTNKDKKIVIIVLVVLFTILDLLGEIGYYDLSSIKGIFRIIACGLLPLAIKHSLLSYLTYYNGIKCSLVYNLIFTLYIYFVPIVPDLGEYLFCLVDLIFPFIVYSTVSDIISKHEVKVNKTKKFDLLDGVLTAVFISLVCLVGGVFNHKLIAIASDSMNPVIYRGDSVLIEKYKDDIVYKKNDIISFDYNGINTVHRIVSVEKKDGEIYYHTKGDNNNSEDAVLVSEHNVYGKVLFKIPYVGYPSIIVDELRSDINEK